MIFLPMKWLFHVFYLHLASWHVHEQTSCTLKHDLFFQPSLEPIKVQAFSLKKSGQKFMTERNKNVRVLVKTCQNFSTGLSHFENDGGLLFIKVILVARRTFAVVKSTLILSLRMSPFSFAFLSFGFRFQSNFKHKYLGKFSFINIQFSSYKRSRI